MNAMSLWPQRPGFPGLIADPQSVPDIREALQRLADDELGLIWATNHARLGDPTKADDTLRGLMLGLTLVRMEIERRGTATPQRS